MKRKIPSILIVFLSTMFISISVAHGQGRTDRSSRSSLKTIVLRMFREKNSLDENAHLAVSGQPIALIGKYIAYKVHVGQPGAADADHTVWLSRDGRLYLEGHVSKLNKLTEQEALPILAKLYPKLESVRIHPNADALDDMQEGSIEIASSEDLPHQQVFTYDRNSHVILLGPLYKVLTLGEKQSAEIDGASVAFGNQHAKSHLVIFSDFECPYCAAREKALDVRNLLEHNNDIEVVFRDYPLQFHPWARTAAIAARCVYHLAPEQYLDFRSTVFSMQQRLSLHNAQDQLRARVTALGVDVDQFNECQHASGTAEEVRRDISAGDKLQLVTTPSLYLDGNLLIDDQLLLTQREPASRGCSQGCPVK
jgi:protein-disulfide isomerase